MDVRSLIVLRTTNANATSVGDIAQQNATKAEAKIPTANCAHQVHPPLMEMCATLSPRSEEGRSK